MGFAALTEAMSAIYNNNFINLGCSNIAQENISGKYFSSQKDDHTGYVH